MKRADVLLYIILIFLILYWRNILFKEENDIRSGLLNGLVKVTMRKCFTPRRNKPLNLVKKSLLCLLLIWCGDIEQCPGPIYSSALRNICTTRGLKISHLNAQGLSKAYNGICFLLGENPETDVLTLSGTHLLTLTTIMNFTKFLDVFVRRDRHEGIGGGVAMYIKETLNWKRRTDLELKDVQSLSTEFIINKAKNVLMTSYYNPPKSSKYF